MRPYNADQVQAVLPALFIKLISRAVHADRRPHAVTIALKAISAGPMVVWHAPGFDFALSIGRIHNKQKSSL
jgi:hypothetical protein